MATKNGSIAGETRNQTAGDTSNQTEEVTLRPVRLAKPARINGITHEAGETVEVDATVGKQLYDADALELPEAYDGKKPAEEPKQA